ncbi:MAG TPA: glycosyltransferase 87 family protein, partial [Saprospiraceae bacterium]|nr:glycosyltransferase 87 family protein [Saprospiraceae bacterium]
QSDFPGLIIPASLAFGAFLLIYRSQLTALQLRYFIGILILVKVGMIFSFPGLSDDLYRFWWDGWLSLQGIHPFSVTPRQVMGMEWPEETLEAIQPVFHNLNSPDYHSVYPAWCQLIFLSCVRIAGYDIGIFTISLKLLFLLADVALLFVLIRLLRSRQKPINHSLLIWANPLYIWELLGNLHFEIFLILFLALAILMYEQQKSFLAGWFLGLSFLSKLWSLFLLPLFVEKPLPNRSNIWVLLGFGIPAVVLAWMLSGHEEGFQNSLALYFRQFEFNSLFYGPISDYLDRSGQWMHKTKISLWLMSVFMVVYAALCFWAWKSRTKGFAFRQAWLVFAAYLLLSSTVHPWYICPLLFLGWFAYPATSLCWSYLAMWSYAHYDPTFQAYDSYFSFASYILIITVFLFENQKIHKTESDLAIS